MLASTSMFQVQAIAYEKDNFALATGYWDGDTSQLRLACRWYDTNGGIGYPQTFGKPQWFLFPEDIKADFIDILQKGKRKVQIVFAE